MTKVTSPVSLQVDVSRLPAKGVAVKLEADDAQRTALAEHHQLDAVNTFGFDLRVSPWKRDGARVSGRVAADISQTCVVSLEPLETKIDEEISALFVPETSRLALRAGDDGEILLDADGDDAPETFSGTRIDVGALAEEFFALAIDPYPRRKDAEIPENLQETSNEGPSNAPFAKLGSLVRKS